MAPGLRAPIAAWRDRGPAPGPASSPSPAIPGCPSTLDAPSEASPTPGTRAATSRHSPPCHGHLCCDRLRLRWSVVAARRRARTTPGRPANTHSPVALPDLVNAINHHSTPPTPPRGSNSDRFPPLTSKPCRVGCHSWQAPWRAKGRGAGALAAFRRSRVRATPAAPPAAARLPTPHPPSHMALTLRT
jgi:hypothetical protein